MLERQPKTERQIASARERGPQKRVKEIQKHTARKVCVYIMSEWKMNVPTKLIQSEHSKNLNWKCEYYISNWMCFIVVYALHILVFHWPYVSKRYPTADTCGRQERTTVLLKMFFYSMPFRFYQLWFHKVYHKQNCLGNEKKMKRKCHFDNGFSKSAVIIYHNKIIINGVERGRFQKNNESNRLLFQRISS